MDACHDGGSCQEILRTTWREYQAYSGFCNMKPEEIRQKKLGVFFAALEAHPRFQNGSHQQLRWSDQHKTPMSNRRKPDGILFASSPGRAANWQNTAVAIEVKDENSTSNSNVLMGQLFQDFLDMAEDQPRHFVIGLTISGDYEANAWLCTPSNLFNCRLGKLLSDKPDFEHHNFVYFLFVLYQQLPKDYGFLVNNRYGLTSAFSVADMLSSTANSGYFEDKMIAIEGGKAFSGRHNVLSGSRSWVYYARIEVPEGQSERVIFKFHWHGVGRSEAGVHRQVLNTGVPYVPQLLYSSGIDTRIESLLFNEYTGEILIIEDCGMGLWQFADSVIDKDCCRLIDMFAGYVHTLLAASTTHPAKFVLHRDISLNNLMVKKGEPRIIDWGCGLVVNRGTTRLPSEAIIMGTAPYMGIRVLSEHKTRTLLDDLESLFLVFSYVLWTKYGIVDETYRILWSGEKDMVAILHRRYSWLSSGVEFIAQMQLGNKLAPELKEFALNLYELLFSTGARTLSNQESDSRAEDFDAKKWLDAFKLSTKKAKDADMPYLGRLEAYVMNITRHDIGLSHKKNKRKASHADLNSEKLSPTRHAKH
ncbi:hypothetical protein BX070DRAFT_99085 [Coemansia spiralis]|nr:hypothetical protein BX070DRAFT_99085 [Coemansia spiralis]